MSADGCRNTEIGKGEEKTLDKGGGKRSGQRTQDRDKKGFAFLVSHQSRYDHKFLVDIPHRVVDQEKCNRQCIDHIADQQSRKSVDRKQLMPEDAGEQSLLSKCVDQSKTVCDRRQQHRENGSGADDLQKSVREVRVMDRVRKQKCEDCRDQRAASGSEKTVSDGAPKSAAGKYFNIMCPESAAGTLERF